jgi:hypothetical protein
MASYDVSIFRTLVSSDVARHVIDIDTHFEASYDVAISIFASPPTSEPELTGGGPFSTAAGGGLGIFFCARNDPLQVGQSQALREQPGDELVGGVVRRDVPLAVHALVRRPRPRGVAITQGLATRTDVCSSVPVNLCPYTLGWRRMRRVCMGTL